MKQITIPTPMAILATLQAAAIVLKLCNFLTAPWIAVLAPIIGPLLVLLISSLFALIIYIILRYDRTTNTPKQ